MSFLVSKVEPVRKRRAFLRTKRVLSFSAMSAMLILSGCASLDPHASPTGYSAATPALPVVQSRSRFPQLKHKIDQLIEAELHPHTIAAIKIVSLVTGETVYETNADLLLVPASNQKLVTAAAALSLLGPGHRLETSVALDQKQDAIYLKGCGDALLNQRELALLAQEAATKLPHKGPYRLSADTSCFDDVYWGAGWMWDDEPDPDSMYLSALSLNRNTVSFRVDPGEAESSPLLVSADPSSKYVTVLNQATTGKAGGACAVSVRRRAGDRENVVTVAGSLAPGCAPVVKRLTVWKPELLALTVFGEQLSQLGVSVSSLNVAPTPPDALPLAMMCRPVSEVVTVMLKQSDNLSAESLVKYLGHVATGREGTAASGLARVAAYLKSKGIAAERLVLADGSGLSRYNLLTAESLVRLLVEAYRDPLVSAPFVDGLPIAGKDGTLARRMKGTAAEGTVLAKTGTMTGVSALSGYAVTAEGEKLAFSMLMQNFAGSSARIRGVQDCIAEVLATFGRAAKK